MKRFAVVLAGLLVLPAFAEIAPTYYFEELEYEDAGLIDIETEEAEVETITPAPAPAAPVANPRSATSNRVPVGRNIPSNVINSNSVTTSASGRSVASRGVSARGSSGNNTNLARTATSAPARATTTRASRGANTTARVGSANNNSQTAGLTTRSASNNAKTANTARAAAITTTDTVNNPLYIGRVSTRSNATISSRVPTIRVSSSGGMSSETVSTAATVLSTDELDELAQLTDFCKAQYTQCMDNFCNVLDDNQGRCSCSVNLKNYEKTEQALKSATEELQEVAQKIQYIGLTGEEVETLFTQTEAELKMQTTTDNTQLKNDLEKIKKMIVDVRSGSATTTDTGISLDLSNLLDFTIDSTGFDLSTLFGGSRSNTASISNQRGETLYKTAAARCKAAVLNSCGAQGVDVSIITNAYDLEIDKQCLMYERSLSESNDQMSATVRNAKSVLQKARLLVEQQKNQYDLRGCVNALDACMQDDFVCGTDYELCLDPTGKYIVNGEVVVGGQPGIPGGVYSGNSASTGLYTVWNYGTTGNMSNAWKGGNLGAFIDATFSSTFPTGSISSEMSTYLQKKIGKIDNDGVATGMCVSVLNRCQDYSYTGKNNARKYKVDNDVIRNYLERVMVQIKAKQDQVLADYAESCISDVAACVNSNTSSTYYATNWSGSSIEPSAMAVAACSAYIKSCRSATGYDAVNSSDLEWVKDVLGVSAAKMSACITSGGTWTSASGGKCTCGSNSTLNPSTGICDCNAGKTRQSDGTCG